MYYVDEVTHNSAYKQQQESSPAYVLLPETTEYGSNFPIISFGHGLESQAPMYLEMLERVCSFGFIIVASNATSAVFAQLGTEEFPAVESGFEFVPEVGGADFADMMLHCLAMVEKAGTNETFAEEIGVPELFNLTDGSMMAMMGHSMGGAAVTQGATRWVEKMDAIVPLHASPFFNGAPIGVDNNIPSFFVTATRDTIVPSFFIITYVYRMHAPPKIVANLKGGTHDEPLRPYTENRDLPWIIAFLLLHLSNRTELAPFLYGRGDNALKGDGRYRVNMDCGEVSCEEYAETVALTSSND